jgi:hypothetical protein
MRGNRSDHPAARRSLRGSATEALGRKLANCMDLLPIRQPISSWRSRHTLLCQRRTHSYNRLLVFRIDPIFGSRVYRKQLYR